MSGFGPAVMRPERAAFGSTYLCVGVFARKVRRSGVECLVAFFAR
jgi:hypothetical protein